MMIELCDENVDEHSIALWLRLFVWMVLSGLFLLCTSYGAAWFLEGHAGDVPTLGEYAWVEVI